MLQTNDPNPNLFVSASSQNLCHLPGLPCHHLSCPCRRPCPLVACRFCPQDWLAKPCCAHGPHGHGWRRRRSRASSCKASLRDSSRIWYHKVTGTWNTTLPAQNLLYKKQKRSDLKWLCGSLEFYLNSSFFSTFPEGSFFFLQCPTLLVLLLVSQRFCWFLQIYFCFRQILALSPALIKFPVVFCIDTFHFFVSVNAFKGNRRQGAAEPKLIGWRMRAVDNDALPVWIPTFLVGTFLTPGKYFARPCFDTLYAYWTSTWRYLKQLSPLLVHMRLLFSLSLLWDTSLGI